MPLNAVVCLIYRLSVPPQLDLFTKPTQWLVYATQNSIYTSTKIMENEENLNQHLLRFDKITISADDVKNTQWVGYIDSNSKRKIEFYSTPLFNGSAEAAANGDLKTQHVLLFLANAATLYYDSNDDSEPLKPMFVSQNGRSCALSDFHERYLDIIAEIYEDIPDAEMRARLADILWIKRKDHKAAKRASEAYLQQAKIHMHPDQWTYGFSRIERSVKLGTLIGKKSSECRNAVQYILELLDTLNGTDPLYLSHKLVTLLLENKLADLHKLAKIVEKSAKNAVARKDALIASEYYQLLYKCKTKIEDHDGANKAKIYEGELKIAYGEHFDSDAYMASAHWFEQGFICLRQGGASEEKLKEIREKINFANLESNTHMSLIEYSTKIDPKIIDFLNNVKGKKFKRAVKLWAYIAKPHNKLKLEESVIANFRENPTANLFPTRLYSEARPFFTIPGLPLTGEPTVELMNMHMWRKLSIDNSFKAWMIEYVQRIIVSEHTVDLRVLDWLLDSNAFVPKDRQQIYERGIQSGIDGDCLIASHLLIPQLENSFRHILAQKGFATTFLKLDGSQEVHPLNKIMNSEEFEHVFGDDLSFELKGLLCEKAGDNLRNNVAHGLLTNESFNSPASKIITPLTIFLLIRYKTI